MLPRHQNSGYGPFLALLLTITMWTVVSSKKSAAIEVTESQPSVGTTSIPNFASEATSRPTNQDGVPLEMNVSRIRNISTLHNITTTAKGIGITSVHVTDDMDVPAPPATLPTHLPVPAAPATLPPPLPLPAPPATLSTSLPVPVPLATLPTHLPEPMPPTLLPEPAPPTTLPIPAPPIPLPVPAPPTPLPVPAPPTPLPVPAPPTPLPIPAPPTPLPVPAPPIPLPVPAHPNPLPVPAPPKKEMIIDDEAPPFREFISLAALPTVFDGVGEQSWTLEQKIIEVEKTVCKGHCGNHFPRSHPISVQLSCEQCHCDRTCITYHTCCPDVILRGQVTFDGLGSECVSIMPAMDAIRDILEPNEFPRDIGSSMITKCYASTNGNIPTVDAAKGQDQEEIQRLNCERPDISIPAQGLPVSDKTSDITYRNVYCARCNNVSDDDLHTWEAKISCRGNAESLLQSATSKRKLFEKLASPEGVRDTRCYMELFSSKGYYRRNCRYPQPPIINTCNETGLWSESLHNVEIETACNMPYTSLFGNKHKNMFCFLCNIGESYSLQRFKKTIQDDDQANSARVSFSALVDFSDASANNQDDQTSRRVAPKCEENQLYDNATCTCQDIKCSEGKVLELQDKTCQSLGRNNLLGYQACAKVEIRLYGTIRDFQKLPHILNSGYKLTWTVSKWCPGDRDIALHVERFDIQGTLYDTLETMEDNLDTMPSDICERIRWQSSFGQVVKCMATYVEDCPQLSGFSAPCSFDQDIRIPQKLYVRGILVKEQTLLTKTAFIKYRKTNRCAFIDVPIYEVEESEETVTLLRSGQSISKMKVDIIKHNHTFVRVCLDDYLQWMQGNISSCKESDDSFDTWTTAGLVSIISSCISLLFLFFTFVTYIFFSQLRTGGGKNIMVLTATLFIAQAMYEFAIEQYENKTLCSVFGVLIHYFWLASIFSMNACTFERFYKLCFPLKSRSFFMSEKPFTISIAYTFLCPFVIVCCNIALNFAFTEGIGYGNSRICYINERYSRIFSFVAPMCTIVVLNSALFIITIVKLRQKTLTGVKKRSQTRIGLVACVRLSLVTGVTWLTSLLYEAVPVPAMGYVFTALLGLQGVVFFFSVVVNKKTSELYRSQLTSTFGSGSSNDGSKTVSATESRKRLKKVVKKNHFHDVVTAAMNGSMLPDPSHTSVTRLTSADSGCSGCDNVTRRDQSAVVD